MYSSKLYHFLILASAISGCISISVFASLYNIYVGITSSTIGLKIRERAVGIKKYKSIIKKKKKKHDEIMLSVKSKLNSIEVLISKALICSNISSDEFVLINNVLKEYGDMKEKNQILKDFIEDFSIWHRIVWCVEKIEKAKIQML